MSTVPVFRYLFAAPPQEQANRIVLVPPALLAVADSTASAAAELGHSVAIEPRSGRGPDPLQPRRTADEQDFSRR